MKQFIGKIKNKITWYRQKIYISSLIKETIGAIRKKSQKKRIYYFLTPTHSNLGDQAQLLCWLRFFKQWYPAYEVFQIPLLAGTDEVFNVIKKNITSHDLVYIHSGYLVCDLYDNWQMLCKVVDCFKESKITILPQTVHFISTSIQAKVSLCFNRHPDLHLICRDKVSYEKAKLLFHIAEISLKPDVVTSLIGTNYASCPYQRNGIMFCMRNDAEKLYSDEQINSLKEKLRGNLIRSSDTTIKADIWDWAKRRENIIKSFLCEFAKYQLIITDRYHGTIFSQIADTPVIVLASTDHKLKSGVDWFPKDIFSENIMFAKDLEEAYSMATHILERKGKIKKNPSYFLDTFYSNPI